MPLLLRTHYNLATTSLKQNRVRSLLTCLGISIGIASIILILSLMGSIHNLVANQVKSIGADLIVVRPTSHRDTVPNIVNELTSASQYHKSNLTLQDVKTIKKLPHLAATAPVAISTYTIKGKNTIASGTILGTNSDFTKIQPLPLKTGTFLNSSISTDTAVIGRSLSLQLFNSTDVIGKTFSVLGTKFIIVGVLGQIEDPINFNNIDFDQTAIIDAKQLQKIDSSLQVQQINIKAQTIDSVPATAQAIESKLLKAKSGDNNFSVLHGDQISHPAGSLLSIISGMLTLVAAISLLVGGIGVMNIMLVSVSERSREIGIRKAVGASSSNILLQFLFEALVLSLLGGFFGLLFGYFLAFLLSVFTPFAPFISWQILVITLLVSLAVGTIFGLYPAIKAAYKNPINALKYFR